MEGMNGMGGLKMETYKNYYFKFLYDEEPGMSGRCLPDPVKTCHFIDCEIHPGLWEAMRQIYNHCKFTNTYIGTKPE
jgi:hypothetical protein